MTNAATTKDSRHPAMPHVCPNCRHAAGSDYEQRVCIDFYGECFTCRFMSEGAGSHSGTPDELAAIRGECLRRWRLQ